MHRRTIIFITLLITIPTFWILSKSDPESARGTWIDFLKATDGIVDQSHAVKVKTLMISLIFSVIFTLSSTIAGYPLPLSPVFCLNFYGHFLKVADVNSKIFTNSDESDYSGMKNTVAILARSLVLSFIILPIISGCITWSIYRVFIRGVLFFDEENRFKRTLSWCGVIYPVAFSISVSVLFLRFFASTDSILERGLYCFLIILSTLILSYLLFRFFFKAWLKRRVFLAYPQEYALYLERSEKVDQGDREARGLGPLKDYYQSRCQSSSDSYGTTVVTGNIVTKQKINEPRNTNDKVSSVQFPVGYSSSFTSVAVSAGKLTLEFKRTEELFRPILVILSISTLLSIFALESFNILVIIRNFDPKSQDFSSSFLCFIILIILTGSLVLSYRLSEFFGRNILIGMRPSQAFAIQIGVISAITIGLLLHPLPLTPMFYLIISIGAVSLGSFNETSSVHDGLVGLNGDFRIKIGFLCLFLYCTLVFSVSIGFFAY